jgi:hypothetical protein
MASKNATSGRFESIAALSLFDVGSAETRGRAPQKAYATS